MHVSLLVSVFNGAERLPDLMRTIAEGDLPHDGFEVIAVDNASRDNTRDVLSSYEETLPLSILSEPRAGKNIALNRALEVARGELLVFTDDDVILPADFLSGYRQLAIDHPDHDLFGSRIVAHWGSPPDEILLNEVPMGTAFAVTDAERGSGPIEANLIYGPSMAIRRKVFDAGLRYDESIGPNGGRYVMGDETDLLLRASDAGHAAWYSAEIVVQHKVREEQHTLAWIERRGYVAGASMVHNQRRRHGGTLPSVSKILGLPRWAVRRQLNAECRVLSRRFRSSEQGRYRDIWDRGFFRGYLSEYRRVTSG